MVNSQSLCVFYPFLFFSPVYFPHFSKRKNFLGKNQILPFQTFFLKGGNLVNGKSQSRNQTSLRSEEHTSKLQSQSNLVCRLLLEKKNLHTHTKLTQQRVRGAAGNRAWAHLSSVDGASIRSCPVSSALAFHRDIIFF